MLDVDMRNPVLDFDLPPTVASAEEIQLAHELLHRLEERYLGQSPGYAALSSAPG